MTMTIFFPSHPIYVLQEMLTELKPKNFNIKCQVEIQKICQVCKTFELMLG